MTAPGYSGYLSNAVSIAVQMLQASATFANLVPAGLYPNDITIESMGGLNTVSPGDDSLAAPTVLIPISGNPITIVPPPTLPTIPYAIVQPAPLETHLVALATKGYKGDMHIILYLPRTANDLPPWILRRARNTAAAIADEIDAQQGTPGTAFMRCSTDVVRVLYCDQTEQDNWGYCEAALITHWSAP